MEATGIRILDIIARFGDRQEVSRIRRTLSPVWTQFAKLKLNDLIIILNEAKIKPFFLTQNPKFFLFLINDLM